jgi:hypothetical protein
MDSIDLQAEAEGRAINNSFPYKTGKARRYRKNRKLNEHDDKAGRIASKLDWVVKNKRPPFVMP